MTHGTEAKPAQSVGGRGEIAAELAGWATALVVGVGIVAYVANTSDWLLFTDGDSVIVPMMVRSVVSGQAQDWALSPVLFLPESVVYGMLSVLGLGMRATLTLNALVNLLAFYGVVRLVAGRRAAGRAPVAGALLAFGVFCGLVLLEGSAALPGLQFATLLATTTYYSATLIATVAVVGLVRRVLDGARPVAAASSVGVVALVSVLTNPLFAVWSTAPVLVVLVALAAGRRVPRRTAIVLGAALAVGSVVGYALRGLFDGTIVAAGGNYFRLDEASRARDHFATVLAQTAQSWHGMLWLVAVAALVVFSAIVAVRAWRRRDAVVAFVAGVAVLAPAATTAGTIVSGSDADRYLQPWVFLPVLVLAVLPRRAVSIARRAVRSRRGRRVVAAIAVASALLVLAVAAPAAVSAATRSDADLACVVRWVDDSGRTGAGQFWTVRAPKANLADPTHLIQVDHTMRVYEWLVNRADSRGAEVTFLVQDATTQAFELPDGFDEAQADSIPCGRYTIVDFGDRVIPLGPPRS